MNNIKELVNKILEDTKQLGSFLWHESKSSYYIKFRDYRMNSIRISDHKTRKWTGKYSLDYVINSRTSLVYTYSNIMTYIKERASSINGIVTYGYTFKDYIDNKVYFTTSFEIYTYFVLNKQLPDGINKSDYEKSELPPISYNGVRPDVLLVDDINLD